ncbi:alpha/beta fold hydrolase [Sphaerotilus mobilis]|uniref:Pimeloyl-ACP methyl ester carboxylesterase n=1 Tax=Sphaerotilus mobilis TaxID=47994 RepID=A0A4Q7LWV8_9BURK|nr:alpha/beta hydrolase [Sphaerotilus mobilis]RZS58319.1 pimeloyl-ACP methyl ester carboxylesterase [Sphaerotilus mobilis]
MQIIDLATPAGPVGLYAYTGGKPWSDDDSRPVVVFVHGALNDHSVWTLPARWFAHHGWRVLAVDLPGHGRSTGPAQASVADLAETLLALLARLGVNRAALVGHSMGSLIGLEAAARCAGADSARQIDHLVLVGTAVPMPVSPALLQTAATEPQKAIDMVVSFAHSSLAAKPGNPGPGTWHHGASRMLMRRVLARSAGLAGIEHNLFHHDFGLCNGYTVGLDAADRIAAGGRTRCAAILGERDRMTLPRAARDVCARLDAVVHSLPHAGHELMQEDPEGLLKALRAALQAG